MPKQVDREARRTELAGALLRVAAREGLGSVSLRHVAAEAGVSMGLVQHYFRTKDEMMTFALGVVSENVQARLAAQGLSYDDPRAVLRALLLQMLPIDDERLREGHAALAYAAYTAVRPEVAAPLRTQMVELRDWVAGAIAEHGVAADPRTAAITLLALPEGLSLQMLAGHLGADDAVAALDAALTAAFGPHGSRAAHTMT